MIGVTGTNGKTSTVQLLAQALDACAASAPARIGTLGAGLHGAAGAERAHHARRGAAHACAARAMRDAGASARGDGSVLARAGPGPRRRRRISTWRCSPTSPATTSTTTATWTAYGAAKARLFAWPGCAPRWSTCDDAFGRELLARGPRRCARIGLQRRAAMPTPTLRASAAALDAGGIALRPASTPAAARAVRIAAARPLQRRQPAGRGRRAARAGLAAGRRSRATLSRLHADRTAA